MSPSPLEHPARLEAILQIDLRIPPRHSSLAFVAETQVAKAEGVVEHRTGRSGHLAEVVEDLAGLDVPVATSYSDDQQNERDCAGDGQADQRIAEFAQPPDADRHDDTAPEHQHCCCVPLQSTEHDPP